MKFNDIKLAVQREKENAIRAKAQLEAATNERERLLKRAGEITGKTFSSIGEIEQEKELRKEQIQQKVAELEALLKEEGVV